MSNTHTYSLVARSLHWLIALLIFWAIVIGLVAEELPYSPEKIQLFVVHKSVGITVLMLALVRLAWRFISPPPALGLSAKEEKLAHLGHWGLYALMISVPLSGWLLNSAAGYPFAWFNLISVPHIPGVGEDSKDLFASVHVVLFYIIAVMVIGHILMLFHHKFSQGINLLPRMLPGKTALWAVVLVAIMAGLIGYTINKANTAKANAEQDSQAIKPAPSQSAASSAASSDSPLWQLVPTEENFQFSSSYSGEAFTGLIKTFTPKIYFDPDHPEQGVLDVTIDTTSLTTLNSEWDSAITGSQWFATSDYPSAHYVSEDIRPDGAGFIAQGELTLKGISKPVEVYFEWEAQGDQAIFLGSAMLDRREFDIGSGSWATDDSIAFEVTLDIDLQLEPAQ
ncbi:cytochrome b/b6 domain-containing protein [Halioxenophilus aromaticivorans]|uniref:YceI family protein n=1 Tax=Halioxenophilus aromaticivorans TaxID=1306992 RepID=A0AAV3U2P9_9ALTE